MKFYQKLDGGAHISAREYDIAADTAIVEGQIVKLADGLVVAAAAGETGAVLGIAAESHSGKNDALDPRADGTQIVVVDDPETVMQCAAPEITAAAGGSATTLIAAELATFANDDFKGGYVKLISKAEGSTNTDEIGEVRRIEGSTASSKAFTLEEGGTPAEGDVYALFPPIGFAKGNLNATGTAIVLTATANLPLKLIGHDRKLNKINLIAGKHLFAVNS